ncbi:LacI family DNA-binding transcriptional regulator [Actinoplanes couchii]|uniref:DNA-binding protein n=1 Tax=Actinoplanes couchii TaxID=403638 RepID=A0ABQ3XCJ4_9ACTN|nr:LacI family DNA-binding transcriptional regulator [Actinoplanes couchii]MDR6323725.1 LacI family transcriptional regulator [Actinoplanes couchii]GID56242.1 DNA-binding protein [Actinoplanes couchii]
MRPRKTIILYDVRQPYRIREIAERAGVSAATVDRVLHRRGGVREGTARAVRQAIAELERPEPASAPARPIVIDVVLQTSPGFGAAVRDALEAEIAEFAPMAVHARPHLTDDAARALDEVGRTPTQGLIVLAPPTPEVSGAMARLAAPVVTLNHDLPAGNRIAHVGVNGFDCGATAAYLVERFLANRAGDVLVINGNGEREAGFRSVVQARRVVSASLPSGSPRSGSLHTILAGHPSIRAVYAAGRGGSAEVPAAFAALHRNYDVFVAHGLDRENAALLREHRIAALLHQDLRADVRHACRAILRARGVLTGPIRSRPSTVRVVTPFNMADCPVGD